MTDVLRLLPPFTWRGIQYPVLARSVGFQHDGAEHKIQYRDGDFREPTGAKSFGFHYTLAMREDIAKGPYKNLFSEGHFQLVNDCRNRTPGNLGDPIYGEFRCVPLSFNDDTDNNKRDGTDIRVEFGHAPDFSAASPDANQNITGLSGIVTDAGQLDQELTLADWKQEPSPEGMTDVLSAINGIARQGLGAVDRVSAQLDDLAFKLEKIETTADLAENPQNWRLRNSARRVREATVALHRRATENPIAKTRRIARKTATTVSAIAAELDMTVSELLSLNPILARSPVVPVGTIITARAARL